MCIEVDTRFESRKICLTSVLDDKEKKDYMLVILVRWPKAQKLIVLLM